MSSQVLKADQSNTSILYGGAYFLKIYRKLERGPNPDVELTRFLSEEQKFPYVPSFAGSIRIPSDAGEGVMALLVGYTANQGDAWHHTIDALDRYYERVLAARATDMAPLHDLIGGVYPERARQLGQRTGEMHLALAASDDHPQFAPEPFTTLYQRSLYQGMRQQIGRNLRLLRRRIKDLPENVREVAETIAASEDEIVERQKRLTVQKITATKTAIHGDYHLGQVLNTGKDFVIIDFEGEPRRSLGERNLKRSPLVDVAGMLRSFHYAAHVALSRQRPEDATALLPWANSWSKEICAAFLAAYEETTAGASFIPQNRTEFDLLLEAFTLDKAIYEVGYELTYRPDWAGVPLGAVCEILRKCTPVEAVEAT
jgi:maltose alpha-D-glucosyltransferase/alpha-amylase